MGQYMKYTMAFLILLISALSIEHAVAGDTVKILGWRYDDVVVFPSPGGSSTHLKKADLPPPIPADDYNDRYVRFQDPASGRVLFARKSDVTLAASGKGEAIRTYCGHATAAMGLSKGC